jgi:hypothetical protein
VLLGPVHRVLPPAAASGISGFPWKPLGLWFHCPKQRHLPLVSSQVTSKDHAAVQLVSSPAVHFSKCTEACSGQVASGIVYYGIRKNGKLS